MVLLDTSVWIRGLAGQQPYLAEMHRLLARNEAAGHELVYGELLIGDRGGRTKFLSSYEQIYQARMVPHDEVVAFVRHRRLHGLGVGWIDVHLLASALAERMQLWTADTAFAAVAQEAGVAYRLAF
jgi:predicted nucleic acid-binding protein